MDPKYCRCKYERALPLSRELSCSSAKTAKELEMAIRKFIPEAQITYKPDPLAMEYVREYFGDIRIVDDSRAREEWGWQPLYTDFEKITADFIQEVRTNPKFYGLA